jgi:16S rRNA (guanine966-N2)-methyltransferase
VGPATRPTSDRVREAIFDILGSMVDLPGMKVADLFAGTGALGIEALSRGAGSVTFVDDDAGAVASIRENLVSTGLDGSQAVVLRRDVVSFVQSTSRAGETPFDLVLCDPPYSYERWDELLEALPADLAVLESGEELVLPGHLMVLRSKRYGSTLVTVARVGDAPQGGLG